MKKNKSKKLNKKLDLKSNKKSKSINSEKIIKTNSKLSFIEKRYCRCLVKVKSRKIKNPYGICTSSVYNKQNKKRTKRVNCSKNYNFKNFTKSQLKYYKK